VLDAAAKLLDGQIIDVDGHLVGKVDDLELTFGEAGPPYVSALLIGTDAWGRRIRGRPGRWLGHLAAMLQALGAAGPGSIPFGRVKRINSAIDLSASVAELGLDEPDVWVRDRVIGKLPGAHHAPE
jgi:sporulation protein YlmC with PRC-barrel domain